MIAEAGEESLNQEDAADALFLTHNDLVLQVETIGKLLV